MHFLHSLRPGGVFCLLLEVTVGLGANAVLWTSPVPPQQGWVAADSRFWWTWRAAEDLGALARALFSAWLTYPSTTLWGKHLYTNHLFHRQSLYEQ